MSIALAEHPPRLWDDPEPEETLDELVNRTWRELTRGERPACLICGTPVEPVYSAHAHPVAGQCRACGTRLS